MPSMRGVRLAIPVLLLAFLLSAGPGAASGLADGVTFSFADFVDDDALGMDPEFGIGGGARSSGDSDSSDGPCVTVDKDSKSMRASTDCVQDD